MVSSYWNVCFNPINICNPGLLIRGFYINYQEYISIKCFWVNTTDNILWKHFNQIRKVFPSVT